MIVTAVKSCYRCGKRHKTLLLFTDTQEYWCFPCYRAAKNALPIVTGEPFLNPENSWRITEDDVLWLKMIGVCL
jgi:hypothetical protein